ncbi:MAG: hypothetical protein NC311_10850 [Muribaculaceae bacterium]|nr:hypothetical protein [Muribaculaceae bacterium]
MSDEKLTTFKKGKTASSSDVNNNFKYLESLCNNLSDSINTLKIQMQTTVQDSLKVVFGSADTSDFTEITGTDKSLLDWLKESKADVEKVAETVVSKDISSKVITIKSPIPKDADGDELSDEQLASLFDGTTPVYNGIYRKSSSSTITVSNRNFLSENYHYIIKEFYTEGSKDDEGKEITEPKLVFKEIYGRIPSHLLYYNSTTKLSNFVISLPEEFYKDITLTYEPMLKVIAISTSGVAKELTPTITKDFENKTMIGTVSIGKNYPDFEISFCIKGGVL